MNTRSRLLPFAIFALLIFAFGAPPTRANTLVESYTAQLSDQDHFSSRGERLRNAAAIIRQDRANFHKFGQRDPADQSDAFFGSSQNRDALERMLNAGTSNPAALRAIVNGTPIVRVSIHRSASGRDFVNVEVAEASLGDQPFEPPASIMPLRVDEPIASYAAHLSEQDHFSSRGERLRSAAAIIRQDRANFHKFGRRDPRDESDPFFSSASNRDALEQMLSRGRIDKSLSRAIIDGTPSVRVEIFRTPSGIHSIQISTAD
jgi:DnaJ-domain-containing protein 1